MESNELAWTKIPFSLVLCLIVENNLRYIPMGIACYHAGHFIAECAKELIWDDLRRLEVAVDGVVKEDMNLPSEIVLVLRKCLLFVHLQSINS